MSGPASKAAGRKPPQAVDAWREELGAAGLSDLPAAQGWPAPPTPPHARPSAPRGVRMGAARGGRAAAYQPDFLDQIGDRDALFALLSRVMPWAQASAAVAALLQRYGSLTEAMAAPEAELAAIADLGPCAAGVLKVAHAAALRLVSAPLKQGPVLNRWPELEAYLMAAMAREPMEEARALFLDTRNRLIADEVLARGGPRGVAPDHRALVHRAVQLHATALILAHNHPSGDPLPSPEDIDTTRTIRDVLAAVGVVLHDHLVVARSGIVSLRQLGVIGR